MNIGEKSKGTRWWTVIEICEPCPHHPDWHIVNTESLKGKRRKLCPRCCLDQFNEDNKQSRRRRHVTGEARFRCDEVRAGVPWHESLWDAGADKKIEEFWRVRGIDPKKKFRYRAIFPKRPSSQPASSSA